MRLRISLQGQQAGTSLGSFPQRTARFSTHSCVSKVTNRSEGGHHARRFCYAMSGMEGGVIERPTLPGLTPRKDRLKKKPPIYKVLLHNDDYNKREYVVRVLLKVVEGYTVEDALNVMQEAHIYGIALVTECSQEKAEEFCEGIRSGGLICTIEPK